MTDILTIIEVIVWILLIGSVLLQNKQVALNLTSMGGWMWEVTKRWADKVLHNATVILWATFIIISVLLFIYS